jgi:hypothetical protein
MFLVRLRSTESKELEKVLATGQEQTSPATPGNAEPRLGELTHTLVKLEGNTTPAEWTSTWVAS